MMRQTAFFNYIFSIICFLGILSCENSYDEEEQWQQLFNGTDLSGWTPKFVDLEADDNYKNTFRVEDSLLQANYSEYDSFRNEFGHLFHEKKFSYYRIRAEYMMPEGRINGTPDWAFGNNGLMLHSQSVESMGLNQAFPISLEMQLLAGVGKGERPNCNLCTPGTHVNLGDTLFTTHCINSTSKTYPLGTWVTVEALVLGDSILHQIVEGDTVMTYTKPVIGGDMAEGATPLAKIDGQRLTQGHISIQAEGHPISFKKIEVLDLCGCMDKKAKNYKSYYLKADNTKCVY
ncbi:MAG: DUF1080 domain-containing protein [Bacteroidota bacterium]